MSLDSIGDEFSPENIHTMPSKDYCTTLWNTLSRCNAAMWCLKRGAFKILCACLCTELAHINIYAEWSKERLQCLSNNSYIKIHCYCNLHYYNKKWFLYFLNKKWIPSQQWQLCTRVANSKKYQLQPIKTKYIYSYS